MGTEKVSESIKFKDLIRQWNDGNKTDVWIEYDHMTPYSKGKFLDYIEDLKKVDLMKFIILHYI